MLTQFVKSINWVDVALLALLIRIVFMSVKSGFIPELFKIFATITAVFVSLHYYALFAALTAKKVRLAPAVLEVIIFIALIGVVLLVFKLLRDGLLMLFKAETTHQGFNQYAAGVLGLGRALLCCSLVMFGILLTRHEGLSRMTLQSTAYKVAGKAASSTYAFLQNQLIGKVLPREKYNSAVDEVLRGKL